MIRVRYTESVEKSLVAQIDAEAFMEWSGGLPVSPDLLAEFLSSARHSWQEELQQLTGYRVAPGGEITAVEHW